MMTCTAFPLHAASWTGPPTCNDLTFILVSTLRTPFATHHHKLILTPAFEGLLGGWSILQAAASAYVSNCTSPGSRASWACSTSASLSAPPRAPAHASPCARSPWCSGSRWRGGPQPRVRALHRAGITARGEAVGQLLA